MTGGPLNSLDGVRVLDLSDDVAGAYCSKLFTDAGAEVLKVEPAHGHGLRRWSRSGNAGHDDYADGVLFRFLAARQRSIAIDLADADGPARVLGLAADSDIVVLSRPAEVLGLSDLREQNPKLTIVSITPYGLASADAGHVVNGFHLQASSGSLHNHGTPDREPLAVGGGLEEWIPGVYAAAGALAARARADRTGRGELVDVSALEALALTLVCYPSVAASVPGGHRIRTTYELVPSIEPCADGFVGLTTLTAQQWFDLLAMIDRHDLIADSALANARTRAIRSGELRPMIQAWTQERDADTILARAASFRVPAAPVLNGETVVKFGPIVERQIFDANPKGGFTHPRPPFRSSATAPRPAAASPDLDEHAGQPFSTARVPSEHQSGDPGPGRPLEGIKVLDATAFWAGPFATQYLAHLGAEVIKIESVQRPDAMRFNVGVKPSTEQWWEYGYLWLSANLDKRGITLNLSDERGRELFLRLVAEADVLVENFTPRVMENFGLTYEAIKAVRPDIVMMSMPGWGSDGPWRDRPGFAPTMEQASGMAFVSGYEGGGPIAPGLCDPLAGIHGSFAVLAALDERRRTGEGQHVELAMIDLAVNVAAEQILEYEAYGQLMGRHGNRSATDAPQGVYRCAGPEEWLALSVVTAEQWRSLCEAMCADDWAEDPSLDTVQGRMAAHDLLDERIAQWCSERSLADVMDTVGSAAAGVVPAYAIDEDERMQVRGFWSDVSHPIIGTCRYPGWPMLLSGEDGPWHPSPAPLLGEHNDEVLRNLGLASDDIDDLRSADVIGNRPLGLSSP